MSFERQRSAGATAPVFLIIVLALFVISLLILISTVPTLYVGSMRAQRTARAAVADSCALELARAEAAGGRETAELARQLTDRYQLASIAILDAMPKTEADNGDVQRRSIGRRAIEVRFRADSGNDSRPMLRLAMIAAVGGSIAGIALLLLHLATFIGRGENDAVREDNRQGSYLFETFQVSINTMRGRETELKRLHEREKERADELDAMSATLVRSLTSGFLALDEEGLVVDLNASAREILGVPAGEGSGRNPIDLFGDTPFARALMRAGDEKLALQREEIEGAGRIIGYTTVPLYDERHRYLGLLALFTDLTPARRLEAQVREMQALADLGEIAAGIAHEFRNSLSTVLGYLKLARKTADPDDAHERIGRAEEEARGLAEAVEALLRFARPMTVEKQRVAPLALLEDVAEQLRGVSGGIDVHASGRDVAVAGDPSLLRRAFENIVRNSIEAIEARGTGQGRIDIRAEDAGDVLRLTVSDDGVGIESDQIARLFLPFQSTKSSGFGLGLALTKKIILSHGGTIRMTSAAGAGATVTIELPRLRPTQQA